MADPVSASREALERGDWAEALRLVAGADDDPEALEVAGIAHWWLDDADGTIGSRERAYRLYRERMDSLGAARVACALAWDSVLFDDRPAVGQGWLDRAASLLAQEPVCAEHAWLAVREAEVALAVGDPERALAAARRAVALAEELGHEEAEVVGHSLEGLALVHEGRVDDGLRRLGESAIAATAGDVDDLMWIGKVCCNLITGCERVGDVQRATQWCDEVKAFARRWQLHALFNTCRTQYASVLVQTGAWDEAEQELQTALEAFGDGRRAALYEGTAQLGELRRRQGRRDEARALFAQSERSRIARVGAAELALDDGDPATALAMAEQLERSTGPQRAVDRVGVLALLVRAAAAADALAATADAAADLERLSDGVATVRSRALAAWALGERSLAAGEVEEARWRLEDAVEGFRECEAPYEQARARLSLARALDALDLDDRARAERVTGQDALRDLARDGAPAAGGPLSRREREVLARVADGMTNRQIAAELVISEHTVHRHVANILRKLGEPTRAAAVAKATRDGLL
jgi:ATP/maltotriose-dependent transcriptional regulator MalT